MMSRTHGVSIFIDYCPATATRRKVEEKERDTGLINRTRLTAVQNGATWYLMACARRGALIRAPPHTRPALRIIDRFWQPRPKSRMASILETVSIAAEFGQQLWSWTNFRCSDRTLISRDRIFDFSQEMVKICAAAWILGIRGNFDRSCQYNQPVQYGRDAAHKSGAAWAFRSFEVYMSENQHYLRGSERELFSQTWRKSAVGDSAEPK